MVEKSTPSGVEEKFDLCCLSFERSEANREKTIRVSSKFSKRIDSSDLLLGNCVMVKAIDNVKDTKEEDTKKEDSEKEDRMN